MHEVNHAPPERMTPQQRRSEIALLLARGLVRLRQANTAAPAGPASGTGLESRLDLAFSGDQRVHSDPVHKRDTEV